VPYPIQLGPITDRMRKFFRIRGRTNFQLDEIVAPVTIIQDLTKGPYQAGVTPAAGTITHTVVQPRLGALASVNILLNDKAGSVTPNLGKNFVGRSFSFTWMEITNITSLVGVGAAEATDMVLRLSDRVGSFNGAIGANGNMVGIQENDGSGVIPVEMFSMTDLASAGASIWRSLLGDNDNTLGILRQYEPEPQITIGPNEVLVLTLVPVADMVTQIYRVNFRGYYQEQPS